MTRYPTYTSRAVGKIGEPNTDGLHDAEVSVTTSMETPFSGPERAVIIDGHENRCGELSQIFVTPVQARELAALLVQAADEAEPRATPDPATIADPNPEPTPPMVARSKVAEAAKATADAVLNGGDYFSEPIDDGARLVAGEAFRHFASLFEEGA